MTFEDDDLATPFKLKEKTKFSEPRIHEKTKSSEPRIHVETYTKEQLADQLK